MHDRETLHDEDEEDTASITIVEPPLHLEPPATAEEVAGATLTVLTGPGAGHLYVLRDDGGTMGRGDDVEIHLQDNTVSRSHARLELREGVFLLHDHGSRNGTFVDGDRVGPEPIPLSTNCKIGLGVRVLLGFSAVDQLGVEAAEQIAKSLRDDPLTGLGNRVYLERRLHEEVSYARRHGQRLGALMLDLDHFKGVNDGYGHLVGDRVLRKVGRAMLNTIRAEDAAFRYGGEEFCILVRGIAEPGLVAMSERIRTAVGQLRFRGHADLVISISIGVAELRPDVRDPGTDLVRRADRALYRAKAGGRDRVVVYGAARRPAPTSLPLAAAMTQGFTTSLPPLSD